MAKSSLAGTGGRQLQEKIMQQEQALEAQRLSRMALRKELEVASPTIAESDQTTLLSGWLHKQSFNISKAERCASLALAPLPLIFSYKSETSLCGTGGT